MKEEKFSKEKFQIKIDNPKTKFFKERVKKILEETK